MSDYSREVAESVSIPAWIDFELGGGKRLGSDNRCEIPTGSRCEQESQSI